MLYFSNPCKQTASVVVACCCLSLSACHDDDRSANDLPLSEDIQPVSASDLQDEPLVSSNENPDSSEPGDDSDVVSANDSGEGGEDSSGADTSSADDEGNAEGEQKAENITALAADTDELSTLVSALESVNLDTVLADTSQVFTVFAPTNEAFAALGEDTFAELLNDSEALTRVLLNHVIIGESVDSETAISLAGTTITSEISVDLGVAFDGEQLTINGAVVSLADVFAENGVVHVIDRVLVPPAETNDDDDTTANGSARNIVETAIEAGSFSILVEALQATELDAVLSDEEALFTVFAPTDDAFEALGAERLQNLLSYPDLLRPILLRHVIPNAEVNAAQAFALAGETVDTAAEGRSVSITVQEGELFIDNAAVVTTDIQTSNGIIHVIDAVICRTCAE